MSGKCRFGPRSWVRQTRLVNLCINATTKKIRADFLCSNCARIADNSSWDVLIYMAPGWQGVTKVDSCTFSKRAKQARFNILPPATNEIQEHMSKIMRKYVFW